METAILIPAYKPGESLLTLLGELSKNGFEMFVVNDGSGDEYNEIFEAAAALATVITQNPNKGKGAALKNGISYIKDNAEGIKYIITADADGQHTVTDIIRISEFLHTNGGFVIGSRKFEGKIPLRSRFGNSITRVIFTLTSGVHIGDTQTGLRGFDRELFEFMSHIDGDRYEYEMNVLLKTARKKIKINEIMIETVYDDGNTTSHFNPLLDSLRIYWEIMKYSAASLLSFCLDFVMLMFFSFLFRNVLIKTTLSVICARAISSPFNYLLNRKLVFNLNANKVTSFLGYFALVIAVLFAKVLLMNLFVDLVGMKTAIANVIVEVSLFISNFIIQKKIIFRKKNK